jgi:hypothetical protein
MRSSFIITLLFSVVLLLTVTPAQAQQSFTCQFTGGPRARQPTSFNGVPGAQPGPVGAPCGDSAGSTGVVRP